MRQRGLRSTSILFFGAIIGVTSSAGARVAEPIRSGSIIAVAFSPDGKFLVSAGVGSPLRLWDPTTGKEVRQLAKQSAWFGSAVFSPDGKYVAATEQDSTIKLFDVQGKDAPRTLGHHPESDVLTYNPLTFTPDGKTLASGGAKAIVLWNVAEAKEIARMELAGRLEGAIAFSPDGKRIASAEAGGVVKLWDIATAKETRALQHLQFCYSVAFAPDGKTLVSGGSDRGNGGGRVKVWEADTGKQIHSLSATDRPLMSVAFSPD